MIAVEVTTTAWGDSEVFGGLLDQVEGRIGQVDGDGAYDTREVYVARLARGADVVVPPRENAVPWEVGHPRSLAENALYRLKPLFGGSVASRDFAVQVKEVLARIAAQNIMIYLGMPVSVRAG